MTECLAIPQGERHQMYQLLIHKLGIRSMNMNFRIILVVGMVCGIEQVLLPWSEALNLAQCVVNKESVEEEKNELYGKCPEVINIAQSHLTDEGVQALRETGCSVLNIAQSSMTDGQLKSLKECFPCVNVAQCGAIPSNFKRIDELEK